jgi:NAD(P)-dependent dehydrogenase (short-subunit alcohol dehydrogenase family)
MAVEGLTASLALEIEAFEVRVKLVEPGYGPNTRFTENGGSRMAGLIPEAYASFAEPIFAAFAQPAAVTTESDEAAAVGLKERQVRTDRRAQPAIIQTRRRAAEPASGRSGSGASGSRTRAS